MNANLEFLIKTIGDPEGVIEAIMVVHAVGTNTATKDDMFKFEWMHSSVINVSMMVIRDFTSLSGKFNIDHIAWMLDVATAEVTH